MTKRTLHKKTDAQKQSSSILSLYPNARGFGYALLDDGELLHTGVTQAKMSKSEDFLAKVDASLDFYEPQVLLLQEPNTRDRRVSKKRVRIIENILKTARAKRIKVTTYTKQQVQEVFEHFDAITKNERAKLLSKWFDDFKHKLPQPRKIWQSEGYTMGAWDALALIVTHLYLLD